MVELPPTIKDHEPCAFLSAVTLPLLNRLNNPIVNYGQPPYF